MEPCKNLSPNPLTITPETVTNEIRGVVSAHLLTKNVKSINDKMVASFLNCGHPLHAASQRGDINLINLLLKLKHNINDVNAVGENALLIACKAYECIVKYDPLGVISKAKEIAVIKLLIEKGCNLMCSSQRNVKPYDLLTSINYFSCLELINKLCSLTIEELDQSRSILHHIDSAKDPNTTELIDVFLNRGIHIDKLDHNGKSLMVRALENGDLKIIKHLKERGATLPKSFCGKELAKRQDIHLIEELVTLGIDVYCVDKEGKSILMYACEIFIADPNRNTPEIRECHQLYINDLRIKGFSFTQKTSKEYSPKNQKQYLPESQEQYSPILLIVRNELFPDDLILNLLKGLPFYEIKDAADILHHTDNIEIIKFFHLNNISMDILDYRGKSPLRYAIERGNIKTIEFLIRAGASKDIELPCLKIAGHKNIVFIKSLHELGLDIYKRDFRNDTILSYACDISHNGDDNLNKAKSCINDLIDLGFSPLQKNGTPPNGDDNLNKAKSFINDLIDLGFSPLQKSGTPPIVLLAMNNILPTDFIKEILEKIRGEYVLKADAEAKAEKGGDPDSNYKKKLEDLCGEEFRNAAQLIHYTRETELINFFLHIGISIDLLDGIGKTVLYKAVERLDINFIKFLLEKRANPNLKRVIMPLKREDLIKLSKGLEYEPEKSLIPVELIRLEKKADPNLEREIMPLKREDLIKLSKGLEYEPEKSLIPVELIRVEKKADPNLEREIMPLKRENPIKLSKSLKYIPEKSWTPVELISNKIHELEEFITYQEDVFPQPVEMDCSKIKCLTNNTNKVQIVRRDVLKGQLELCLKIEALLNPRPATPEIDMGETQSMGNTPTVSAASSEEDTEATASTDDFEVCANIERALMSGAKAEDDMDVFGNVPDDSEGEDYILDTEMVSEGEDHIINF